MSENRSKLRKLWASPRLPTRKDGLGRRVRPDEAYYVQDTTRDVGSDSVVWWKPESSGYTKNLDDAGAYLGIEVDRMRPTDVPWPVDFVQRKAIRTVAADALRR